ncbi:MAG: PhzF family phenazine biosynthesis protein [Sphingomonadales bacterium]|jgi:trans-2,3-dihydro-3-hydroxyanthranilate isomerase
MQMPYVTCDVFTNEAFGGNPLAVCYDARGLNDAQMQQIATEFNYSETTFVLSPEDPKHDAQVRIFTPVAEIAFAGHPNVGTAIALAHLGRCNGRDRLIFEERAGLVPIDLVWNDAQIESATLTAPQSPKLGEEASVDVLVNALKLIPEDILVENHKPIMASAGVYFLILEVRDLDALAHAQSPSARESEALSAEGIFLYCRTNEVGGIRARMFAPNHGIVEDPATGSAVAAFMGLEALREKADGKREYKIVQGVEMGRPSYLNAAFERQNGRVMKITVGGQSIMMREGVLTL